MAKCSRSSKKGVTKMLPPLYVVIVNLYEILKFILLYTISVLKQLSSTASKKPRIKPISIGLI